MCCRESVVIYQKLLKSTKGKRKDVFKVLHNVIVCTCIWRGVGKGIKGFSQLGHILSMII